MFAKSEISIGEDAPTIVLRRAFAAPRALVFEAWSKAEHLRQWWDPSGTPLLECDLDFRVNGKFRWITAGQPDMPFAGVYKEISPPERLVFRVETGGNALGTLLFEEHRNTTILTMTMTCATVAERNAMLAMRIDQGTDRTLGQLANYLRSL